MDIVNIFDEVAGQMRSDLKKARTVLQHPGLKGASIEETIRTFLREYLPKSLDISTGTAIDSTGNYSRQLDVIISDAFKTPIFYRSGQNRVIPIECIYAVIEVKTYLGTRELNDAFENMRSVRRLQKKAYVKPSGDIIWKSNLYGREWDIIPTNYFVFTFDSSDLKKLAAFLDQLHQEASLPEWSRIDTICVLDKGVICNRLANGKFNALPEPNSQLFVCQTNRSLLLFYSLIGRYLFQARMPDFLFTDYLGQLRFE
jgi:hypothetical protein